MTKAKNESNPMERNNHDLLGIQKIIATILFWIICILCANTIATRH